MIKKKIEWQGSILNPKNETPVFIENRKQNLGQSQLMKVQLELNKIIGKCSLRLEKKGRGGNPAVILFKFSDPEAKNTASLKKLCSELKIKLACGGTIENGEILLTLQNIEKVKKILTRFFNIQV